MESPLKPGPSREPIGIRPSHFGLIFLVLAINGMLLYVGVPLEFLDGRFHYAASEIHPLFNDQGHAGRMLYEHLETIDLLFILLYTWLLVELTRVFSRGIPNLDHRLWKYAPTFLGAAADAVETVGILSLLKRFPERAPELERLVSLSTPVKWIGLALAVAQLGVLLGFRIRSRVRGQRLGSSSRP